MNAKISVIIPCFNYGHYLKETLNKLRESTYKNWEALVIDDGSTDYTESIVCRIAEEDQRVLYIKQFNQGVSVARNEGIKYSSGKYIQFLDADDFLSDDKLFHQVEFMEANPEIDISYTDCHYFQSHQPDVWYPDFELKGKEWMPYLSGKKNKILKTLMTTNIAVISSPLVKKDFIDQNQLQFFNEFGYTEDWRFWCECAFKNAKIVFFNHPKAYTLIRVHDQSVSQQTEKMRFGELALRKWLNFALSNSDLSELKKQDFKKLNQQRTHELVRHMIFTGPLFDRGYMQKFMPFIDLKYLLKFFFKALNRKRKTISLINYHG
jgi:glycosyltransferase involved in cell wall biosynthesis